MTRRVPRLLIPSVPVPLGDYPSAHQGVVVAPPPPPPPPVTGSIVFKVNYASAYPWGWDWGIQAGNHDASTDSMHVGTTFDAVADPGGTANTVARIVLPGDSSRGRAAEGLHPRNIDLGVTDFFGWSIRVPSAWLTTAQNTSWHSWCAQMNYGSLGGAPLALQIDQNGVEMSVLAGQVSADSAGNATGYQFQANANQGPRLMMLNSLAANTWLDFIIEVKWETTFNGYVNSYYKSGGVWTKVLDSVSVVGGLHPTMQWCSVPVEGNVVSITGIDQSTGQPYRTADKAGLYVGPNAGGYTIWHRTGGRYTTLSKAQEQMNLLW